MFFNILTTLTQANVICKSQEFSNTTMTAKSFYLTLANQCTSLYGRRCCPKDNHFVVVGRFLIGGYLRFNCYVHSSFQYTQPLRSHEITGISVQGYTSSSSSTLTTTCSVSIQKCPEFRNSEFYECGRLSFATVSLQFQHVKNKNNSTRYHKYYSI